MKVVITGRYTDQWTMESFLTRVFGWGTVRVEQKRGRYICTIPRPMTPSEIKAMQDELYEHYEG